MSETEQEQTEPTEPTEPEAPEPDDEPEPEAAPEPEPEPAEQDGASLDAQKAELDEAYTRLETKAKNYVRGIGDILEASPVPVVVCEMCADAFPGVRWLEPSDETHAQLIAVVSGGFGVDLLEADPDAEECPACKGKGGLKLPSKVPGNEARTCKRCNGAGYLERHPESGTPIAPVTTQTNGTVEPYAGIPLDDPAVADLRARGFTIVPPMQPITPEP